jgi:cell division protein FtsB
MKKTVISILACTLLLAGCGKGQDAEIAKLKTEVTTAKTELDKERQRNETLLDQNADYDGKLKEARSDADSLRIKLDKATRLKAENERLTQQVGELKAEIETLKEAKPETDPTVEEPSKPTKEPDKPKNETLDPAVKQRLEELLPLVKAGADRKAINDALDLVRKANKPARDEFIKRMQDWVKEEPKNEHARYSLAQALTARFQDIAGQPMKQGALAGQVKEELDKALEVDPDFYDAVRFKAVLEVNYPVFTPEFKEANLALDKAIELQDKMTWEDRFADMYTAYAEWYFKQNKLDQAADKVQAGLDHAPRNQGLLDEKKKIEDAQNESEGN